MKVSLVAYTPHPEKIVFLAARLCYSSKPLEALEKEFENRAYVKSFLSKLIALGHHSVLEHASFTFLIEDISRIASHQLVRHRIASYSQQSQRYVDMQSNTWVIPESIPQEFKNEIEDFLNKSKRLYAKLTESGVPKEDARFFLPQAITTKLFVTMNARELRHFFSLRCHPSAQWEIRKIAKEMLKKAWEVAPVLFEDIYQEVFHENRGEVTKN